MSDASGPASGRDSFARYRSLLDGQGFRPAKRLGQNFLLDPSLHRAIADAAGLDARDVVLEAGPGLGFLTRELAARAGRVVAVEIDARLHEILGQELGSFPDGGRNVRLVHGDVLAARHRLHPTAVAALRQGLDELDGRLVVVANLPYAITGPFLAALVALERPPDAAVLLLQHDLALRLAARPGSKDYGALSVLVQCAFAVRIERKVGREVFRPRPNVDSAIVVFARAPDRAADGASEDSGARALLARSPVEREAFAAFLQALFGARRKQLRNSLPRALAAAGRGGAVVAVDAELSALLARRPEELPAGALLQLWDRAAAVATGDTAAGPGPGDADT